MPLLGAEGLAAARGELSSRGFARAAADRLLGRYGALAVEVAALATGDPVLARSLPGAEPYLSGEAVYAVTHERALRLDDVLTRRTRISIEAPDRGAAAAPVAAGLMAPLIGWDRARREAEVARYLKRLEAERGPDDDGASRARTRARDPRLVRA